jgi:hypothetical protein
MPIAQGSPFAWGIAHDERLADTRGLLDRLYHTGQRAPDRADWLVRELEEWLNVAQADGLDRVKALETLAWTTALPDLTSALPAAPWGEVFDFVRQVAAQGTDDEDPLLTQWLGCELPLTLAYLFPEVSDCRRLLRPAVQRLSRSSGQILDGNGLPTADCLPEMRMLLACWTRCDILLETFPGVAVSQQAQLSREWFLRQCLAMTRDDGSQMLAGTATGRDTATLFEAALNRFGDDEDRAIADQAFPWRSSYRAASQAETYFPDSAANSEWAKVAVLRPNWLRGSARMVVDYRDPAMQTELTVGDRTLWTGRWTTDVSVDGRMVDPVSDWEELCWHSDDDVDYLELQLELEGDWRLQRQLLMVREDKFLFAADALLGQRPATIRYESCLPLAEDVVCRPEKETRESYLVHRQLAGLVLPLALPEWRSAQADGCLKADGSQLWQVRELNAPRMYLPLFVDLDRNRLRKPVTWRHLTVGCRLQNEPPSAAAGYRVQIGREQWLFYRSLGPAENRTLLGQNLLHEFYAARFGVDGTTEDLLAIDAAE